MLTPVSATCDTRAERCPNLTHVCKCAPSVQAHTPHPVFLRARASSPPLAVCDIRQQQNKKGEAPQQSKKEESKKNKRARYAVDNQKTLLERQQVCSQKR